MAKKDDGQSPYITTRQAGDILGLRSLESVYRLIREGHLICIRPRKHRRILRSSVEQYQKSLHQK